MSSDQSSVGSRQRILRGGVKFALLLMVSLTAVEYARWTFFDDYRWAQAIAYGLQKKPFVYRALVPWLAHLLVLCGLQPEIALTVIVVFSALGSIYGIKYLLASFRKS